MVAGGAVVVAARFRALRLRAAGMLCRRSRHNPLPRHILIGRQMAGIPIGLEESRGADAERPPATKIESQLGEMKTSTSRAKAAKATRPRRCSVLTLRRSSSPGPDATAPLGRAWQSAQIPGISH